MKYKFYSIRLNVTKYDITFATMSGFDPTKGRVLTSSSRIFATGYRAL